MPRLHFVTCVFLVVVSTACGATVLIEDGDGGAGADGSGAEGQGGDGAASTTSSDTVATTVTSTGGFTAPCDRLCMEHPNCFDDDCLAWCNALYEPGCESETDAYVICLAHNFARDCTLGSSCDDPFALYVNCTDPAFTCVDGACEGSDTECFCSGTCGEHTMIVECKKDNDDFPDCVCTTEAGIIGECSNSALTCSLDIGCCKEVLVLSKL